MPTGHQKFSIAIEDPEISDAICQAADARHALTRHIVADALRKSHENRVMELDRIAGREARADAEPITDFDDYVAKHSQRA